MIDQKQPNDPQPERRSIDDEIKRLMEKREHRKVHPEKGNIPGKPGKSRKHQREQFKKLRDAEHSRKMQRRRARARRIAGRRRHSR